MNQLNHTDHQGKPQQQTKGLLHEQGPKIKDCIQLYDIENCPGLKGYVLNWWLPARDRKLWGEKKKRRETEQREDGKERGMKSRREGEGKRRERLGDWGFSQRLRLMGTSGFEESGAIEF